jgi:hypothetical protein
MAHSQLEGRAPLKGASAMRAYVPIAFIVAGAGGSSLSETVLPAGSFNDLPFGITSATVATAGDPISYWQRGDVAKCVVGQRQRSPLPGRHRAEERRRRGPVPGVDEPGTDHLAAPRSPRTSTGAPPRP